jgi:hypothetical protein
MYWEALQLYFPFKVRYWEGKSFEDLQLTEIVGRVIPSKKINNIPKDIVISFQLFATRNIKKKISASKYFFKYNRAKKKITIDKFFHFILGEQQRVFLGRKV